MMMLLHIGRLWSGVASPAGGDGAGSRRSARRRLLEPLLREIVSAHLGVDREALGPEVSLADDLAVDSLDLVELGLAVEAETGVALPDVLLADVRTYGDLVEAVRAVDCCETIAESRAAEPPFVWVQVVRPTECASADLYRDGWLTPYNAEVILEDAMRAGPGARIEVKVPPHLTTGQVAELRAQLAWLAEHGVGTRVMRQTSPGTRSPDVAA